MNDLLKNEPVKRVERALNLFNKNIKIKVLENTAKTALDASKSLKCEIGAIVKSLLLRKDNTFFLWKITEFHQNLHFHLMNKYRFHQNYQYLWLLYQLSFLVRLNHHVLNHRPNNFYPDLH